MPMIETKRGPIWVADQRRDESPRPPLLLIHGAGGSRLDWPGELRRLPGIGVIAVDLPAHGRSPGAARASVAEYAEDLCALLDALEIDSAVIAGHSLGGAIALQLALEYPERAAGLILIGSGAKLGVHPDILGGIERDQANVAKLLVKWFWGPGVGDDVRQSNYEQLTQIAPDVLLSDFEVANSFDIRARLSEIAVPTLILVGSDDQMTPPRSSQYLEQHIEGARLVQFEGAGHKLPLEQPAAVAEAVAEWLASLARS